MEEEHHGHEGHDHPHDPIRKIEPQLPEHVLRLISLGETMGSRGLWVVEDNRLKGDELKAKGLTKGLSYFEKRFTIMRTVLAEKGIVSPEELQTRINILKESGIAKDTQSLALEVMAATDILVEKEVVKRDELDRKYEQVRARTPMTGARIVARAWVDPDFKKLLKNDAVNAITKLDSELLSANSGEPIDTWRVTHLKILENEDKVRNVVVCTLCSCYPRGLLGEPPEWYTSEEYRERVVKEPRKVLAEMGDDLPDSVEIRIFDSTADTRYMVIPNRPAGTEAFSEEQLADLVTRDSLIGVADAESPPGK